MKLKKRKKTAKAKPNGSARNWKEEIAQLKKSRKTKRYRMGTPGSAQVTRVRLLQQHSKLKAHTEGEWLELGF